MTRRRRALAVLAAVPVLLAAGPAAAASSGGAAHAHRAHLAGRNGNCLPEAALGSVFHAYPLERTPLQSAERPAQTFHAGRALTLSPPRSSGQPVRPGVGSRITPLARRQAERGPPVLS